MYILVVSQFMRMDNFKFISTHSSSSSLSPLFYLFFCVPLRSARSVTRSGAERRTEKEEMSREDGALFYCTWFPHCVTRSGAERRTEKEEMSREDYCTWFRHCHTERSGTENRERRNVQGR